MQKLVIPNLIDIKENLTSFLLSFSGRGKCFSRNSLKVFKSSSLCICSFRISFCSLDSSGFKLIAKTQQQNTFHMLQVWITELLLVFLNRSNTSYEFACTFALFGILILQYKKSFIYKNTFSWKLFQIPFLSLL